MERIVRIFTVVACIAHLLGGRGRCVLHVCLTLEPYFLRNASLRTSLHGSFGKP